MTEDLKSQLDYFKDEPKYLRKVIDELEQENKELKEKYTHVLELAKTNADSNEYCLQELEKENEELKALNKKICEDCSKEIKVYWAAFEEIREIVKPYLTDCQGSLCEPIDEVLNKINEVLNG